MFPIIPAHMLNGTPTTSFGKMAVNSANSSYSNSFWNIWTEDFLRTKYVPATSSDSLGNHSIDEHKIRDTKRTAVKKESQSHLNSGSYAIETIPKDSKTRPFDCIDTNRGHLAKIKSFINIDSSGYIVNDQHLAESVWLQSLTLARDTYSHNAQLEITGDHRLRVKIVKNLVIDEEIQLWFSDEILAIIAIPFLAPANILGKNCYKCAECDRTYENPNPLKIHLATKCDQYGIDDLWSRLNNIMPLKSYATVQLASPFRQLTIEADRLRSNVPFAALPSPHFQSIVNQTSSSTIAPPYHHHYPIRNLQQISAFRPVPMNLSPPPIHQFAPHSGNPFHQHPQTSSHSVSNSSTNQVSQGEKVVAAAAAQLETIVSNMGTSKQGHICIYCGKLYSRKYGLKIHIRTHTGFKPLKCKYCLRPFGDPSNLNKHIRLHVQEKSLYKCHLCSKILVRRRDLLRHMNIKHNGSKEVRTARMGGECENSNDNTTISSVNELNGTNSSRSNSVNSDVPCDISSNDDAAEEDDEFDVRVEVD